MRLVILIALLVMVWLAVWGITYLRARRQERLNKAPWSVQTKELNDGGAVVELFRPGHPQVVTFEKVPADKRDQLTDIMLNAEEEAAERNQNRQLEETINRRQKRLYS